MSQSVLVDGPIWSLSLRRPRHHVPSAASLELAKLITEKRVLLIGPIRQEVLSGIAQPEQYQKIDQALLQYPNAPLVDADYREAARCFNLCRARGVQGSHVDFLLCAVALRLDRSIFTTDADFLRYQGALAIRLYAA